MMGTARRVVLVLVLTALVAAAGGWAGVRYGLRESRASPSLDELIHHELALTSDQQRQIQSMEAAFATQRRALETQMRAANRELAAAIAADHRYGPAAERAVEHFHAAMQSLQRETVEHVLAMRAVLTPAQAIQFDQTITKALESDQP